MENKPLNVRAYEAVFGTVADEIAYGVRPYDIDDPAALHLLKAAKRSGLCDEWAIGVLPHGFSWCSLMKSSREISSADDDDSLARAICLAVVAAKESH